MSSLKPKIRVHLMVPEYFGATDSVLSAFRLVRKLVTPQSPISISIIDYPEVNQIDSLEYSHKWDGKKWIAPASSFTDHFEKRVFTYEKMPTDEVRKYLERPEDLIQRMEAAALWVKGVCRQFSDKKDLYILMNPYGNTSNYFSGKSPTRKNVAFIQSTHFITETTTAPHIPIAYEILAMALRFLGFNKGNFQSQYAHVASRSCVNDAFGDITDIRHRILSADICDDCLAHLIHNAEMSNFVIDFFYAAFEHIRSIQNTFQRYSRESKVVLEARVSQSFLMFPSIGARIKLSPKEMTVYKFFLAKGQKGISYNDFVDYEEELIRLYLTHYKGSEDYARVKAEEIVARWTDPHSNQDLREVISKINRKIKQSITSRYAEGFQISRVHNIRKISQLVSNQ